MDKEMFLELMKWLETASDEEMDNRKALASQTLDRITDPGLRADVQKIITEIDKEIFARLQAKY